MTQPLTDETARERASGSARPVEVSVIVPVRNEEAFLAETVPAILGQRYTGGIEFLFVDGRSGDRSRGLLEDFARADPRVRVLDNPRRDQASALNIGLRNASGELIVQMDAHTYYGRDYLRRGVDRLLRGDVAWVSGPPVPLGASAWSRRVALALDSWLGTGGSKKWRRARSDAGPKEIELDSTAVFAGFWRRSLLEQLGGWDERFPVNHDVELAARVRKAGGKIVCLDELGSRYVPRASLPALAKQYFGYGYYRVRTSERHPEALRRSQLLSPALVLAVVLAGVGPRGARRVPRAALLAYGAAVLAASVTSARRASRVDAAALPLVFATMHASWGAGFLCACAAHGLPLAALARATGLSCLAGSTGRRRNDA